MEGGKKLWIKVLSDLLIAGMVVGSWAWYVVEVAEGFQVGVWDIKLHTTEGKLDVYVMGSYSDFCFMCPSPNASHCSKVCTSFQSAGKSYFALSLITLLLLLFSVINLICLSSGCLCCLSLKLQFTHYSSLFSYTLALFLYAVLSGLFALDVKLGPGFFAMCAIELALSLNLILFLLVRREFRKLSDSHKEAGVSLAELSPDSNP